MELDIFKGNKLESFGGQDLATNMANADIVIAKLEDDFRVFNHSNSQFVWSNFILSHKGSLRNIRQIVAEISRKRDALIEAKFRHLEKMAMADVWREKMTATESPAEKKLFEIRIEKTKKLAALALAPIEGALKDISILYDHYQDIIKAREKDFTEKDFENEEISYWIKRCFSQCLRDLRQFGSVSKGEQEPLENMGLNVSYITEELNSYLELIERKESKGNCLNDFLDLCVDKYSEEIKARTKIVGGSCFELGQ